MKSFLGSLLALVSYTSEQGHFLLSTLSSATQNATALEKVWLEPLPNGVNVVIQADGNLEHVVSLHDPVQLVLDIPNVKNPLESQESPHPLLARIQMEEHEMVPSVIDDAEPATFARLVFELRQPVGHRIWNEGEQIRLALFPYPASSPTNKERDRAAEPSTVASLPPTFVIEPPDVDPGLFFGPLPSMDDYPLGPEDVLEVNVFELEQFNRTVRVSGDGYIQLPLIGAVRVQGLLPDDAAARVADALRDEFVQNPQVSIFVQQFNSRRLSLLGAVSKPATYQLLGRRSLLEVLSEAGGVTNSADESLFVFRQTVDGRRARLVVPLSALLVEGDPRWDIWLVPGDVVSVPLKKSITISILGAVARPGMYDLPEGEASLLKAIALAGGLTQRGSERGLEIQRSHDSQKVVLKIDLGDILSGKKPDTPLREGDVINVNEKFF